MTNAVKPQGINTDQLREALNSSDEYAHGRYDVDATVYQAAQAHLKLLDGIEGLRIDIFNLPEGISFKYAYANNHALDAVMKLIGEK